MKTLLFIPVLALCACATQPRTYQPPDATRLKASTARLSSEVDKSHVEARKAATAVTNARQRAKEVAVETAKIKNVPVSLTQKVNDLETQLVAAQTAQAELEKHLVAADQAKVQVEKDKGEYFGNAQKLADEATNENAHRVKAEKVASYYRWHFWLSWIVFGLGVVACIVLALLKLSGKLSLLL